MSLYILEQALTAIIKEIMEKDSLVSMAMYDAVPVPKVNLLDVYTCDITFSLGKYVLFTGTIVTKTLERAYNHWGDGDAVTHHRIKIPADTTIMWYDSEFGEVSKFSGERGDRLILEEDEVIVYEV